MILLRFYQNLIMIGVLIASPLAVNPVIAQDRWTFSVNDHDRREASFEKNTIISSVACEVELKFVCTNDRNGGIGNIAMQLTIAPSSKLSDFDFGFFEGPYAPVGAKKLMNISLTKAGRQTNFQVGLSGWFSADKSDGFVFATSSPTEDRSSDMRRLIKEIENGSDAIEVAVTDGTNPSKVIAVTFPLTNAKGCFQGLLKGID